MRYKIYLYKIYLRLDVLMMSILDKQNLNAEEKKKKLEVIKILGEFLRKPNSKTRDVVPTWDRERDDNAFSWLGWTVVNGTAEDVAALISSKQPFDPLLGMINRTRLLSMNIKLSYGGVMRKNGQMKKVKSTMKK